MDRVIRETEDVIQRTVVGWSGGGGWYLRGLGERRGCRGRKVSRRNLPFLIWQRCTGSLTRRALGATSCGNAMT
jgi:hypothetical protein